MSAVLEIEGEERLRAEAAARPLIDGEPRPVIAALRGAVAEYVAVLDRATAAAQTWTSSPRRKK